MEEKIIQIFYLEDGNGGVNFTENDENFFDISVGLALGKKWINSAGFVFEIKLGGGRNLLNASEFDAIIKGDNFLYRISFLRFKKKYIKQKRLNYIV